MKVQLNLRQDFSLPFMWFNFTVCLRVRSAAGGFMSRETTNVKNTGPSTCLLRTRPVNIMKLTLTPDLAVKGKISYFPSRVFFCLSAVFPLNSSFHLLWCGRKGVRWHFFWKPLKYFLWLATFTPKIPHPSPPSLVSLSPFLSPSSSVKQLDDPYNRNRAGGGGSSYFSFVIYI